MKELGKLNELEDLELYNTQTIDGCIAVLKEFEKLSRINVFDSRLTDVGIATLRKALPKCEVMEFIPFRYR